MMKYWKFSLLCVTILFILTSVLFAQSPAQQNSPFNDLIDNKREGLFVGGGVAYGTTRFSMSFSDSDEINDATKEELAALGGVAGHLNWRLGYAISEDLAFYVTSLATDLQPSLGIMKFFDTYPGYYGQALIGYSSLEVVDSVVESSVDEETKARLSTWNIGLGVGYEFRPHFMVELTGEYSRLTIPDEKEVWVDSAGGYGYVDYEDYNVYLNRTMIFVSFNYLFY